MDEGRPAQYQPTSPIWAMLGAVVAGVLLLAIRTHLPERALRDAFAALAYGAFTVAAFEGAAAVRGLVAGAASRQRRSEARPPAAAAGSDLHRSR